MEPAPESLELFGPHADICLVDEEPAVWSVGRQERPDALAVEVETLWFDSSEEEERAFEH